ncbi:hypothetical protein BH20BAC1_BH20BAC1_17340 [soil metagenome]
MKKIVVDTNIIFSCLLNSNGTIGDIIFNSDDVFDFYSNQYMRFEIRKHWNKLKNISKLSDLELETAYDKMLAKLTFINEELIPQTDWEKAEESVKEIDLDDIDFVALTKFLKGTLWTSDKSLYEGLKSNRFRSVHNTQDIIKLRSRMERQ